MGGRELRMRLVTMEPGAVFGPKHDHRDRRGVVHVLAGTITDHRDGVTAGYGPGLGWPEDREHVALAGGPGLRGCRGGLGRHHPVAGPRRAR